MAENQPAPQFDIPAESAHDVTPDSLAVQEGEAFSTDSFANFAFRWDWILRYSFKIVLFGFVLGINICGQKMLLR